MRLPAEVAESVYDESKSWPVSSSEVAEEDIAAAAAAALSLTEEDAADDSWTAEDLTSKSGIASSVMSFTSLRMVAHSLRTCCNGRSPCSAEVDFACGSGTSILRRPGSVIRVLMRGIGGGEVRFQ